MLVPCCVSCLLGVLSAPHDEGCRLGRPDVQLMPPSRNGPRHKHQRPTRRIVQLCGGHDQDDCAIVIV
eukprot:444194-Pyramimonas_sp.AAC.1